MSARRPARLLGRRRVLHLLAGCTAMFAGRAAADAAPLWRWRGQALGAASELRLAGGDRAEAADAVAACLAEVARLEAEFSLFRPDSALSRLNRAGVLHRPSSDMQALLRLAIRLAVHSDGAFDPSVQPLWECYARHFRAHPGDPAGPPAAALAAARSRVGYDGIAVSPDRIRLAPGMALTLNGIAQGYITERIAGLLGARGWRNVLVQLGEIRGLGGQARGAGWPVVTPAGARSLKDRAVAVSAGAGTVFEPGGRHHHLLDPSSGRSAGHFTSVTVIAPGAALADGLSTALALLPEDRGRRLLAGLPDVQAVAVTPDGRRLSLGG